MDIDCGCQGVDVDNVSVVVASFGPPSVSQAAGGRVHREAGDQL